MNKHTEYLESIYKEMDYLIGRENMNSRPILVIFPGLRSQRGMYSGGSVRGILNHFYFMSDREDPKRMIPGLQFSSLIIEPGAEPSLHDLGYTSTRVYGIRGDKGIWLVPEGLSRGFFNFDRNLPQLDKPYIGTGLSKEMLKCITQIINIPGWGDYSNRFTTGGR